jgi:hypothetical protein
VTRNILRIDTSNKTLILFGEEDVGLSFHPHPLHHHHHHTYLGRCLPPTPQPLRRAIHIASLILIYALNKLGFVLLRSPASKLMCVYLMRVGFIWCCYGGSADRPNPISVFCVFSVQRSIGFPLFVLSFWSWGSTFATINKMTLWACACRLFFCLYFSSFCYFSIVMVAIAPAFGVVGSGHTDILDFHH